MTTPTNLTAYAPGPRLSALTGVLSGRRRALQLALGMIWLLDAALQYQPYMFTRGFVSQVIQGSAAGNPAVIAGPITWSAALMARNAAACNAVFATIQLLIGAGLLFRPTARAALAASIPWALGVWWIGEGLGGMLAGTADPVMGAPGAAVLYAFLALLAWPHDRAAPGTAPGAVAGDAPGTASVATTGRLGRALPRVVWAALWGSLAGFVLQPADRSPGGLSTIVSGMKTGEPRWIAAMDGFGGRALAQHGTAASVLIAALCVLAAVALASGRLTRIAVIAGAVLGAAFWAAQDFGAIFTGQGTDPNSGLLLIVLAVAFWPAATRGPRGDHSGPPVPVGETPCS